MREILIAGGLLGALVLFGALWLVEWQSLMVAGLWVLGAGWALGLPFGVAYHVLLYRALRRAGPLPRRWLLRPGELNDTLDHADRRRVMPLWYVAGGGFGVIVLGLVLLVTGMVVALSSS